MARKQQVVRFDRERDDDLSDECAGELCERLRESLAGADVVILEDYNKGVLTPPVIRTALEVAAERGIPVVVDPKFRHIFEYRGATLFKPNAFEITFKDSLQDAVANTVEYSIPQSFKNTIAYTFANTFKDTLSFSNDLKTVRVPQSNAERSSNFSTFAYTDTLAD